MKKTTLIITVVLSCCLLFAALIGCKGDDPQKPVGTDGNRGNLLEYDTREDTQMLVDKIEDGTMPTSVEVFYDDKKYPAIVSEDPEDIEAVYKGLKAITIERPVNRSVTDAYHHAIFMFEDGSKAGFSFEHEYLEIGSQNYEISGTEDFWAAMHSVIEKNTEDYDY